MDTQTAAGFKEREHAADWELEAWAPDLPGLLVQAARGMNSLMGVVLEPGTPVERRLSLAFLDAESLLVAFLNELLYYLETENLAFESFELHMENQILNARLFGAQVVAIDKEIKAATYHNLEVQHSQGQARARVVLDV
jgi:SHS2 domain-containing protein